ncbi:O-antigen polymerase [Terracoccus luteus]|uniref:O-antigen polysaccharide polymerase Wzy-like protein n=1 Tax=Terracoccus luteus TaxID=53356 RepID=A0A839PR59_9MICO|nr:O-antigen polymerase [Terracoccus luteus]MBB2985549.1 hypothetical protein [Terracoccus luteus]MCP2171201.1 hypothetical protein [Terracoccus luteus]
MTSPVAMRRSVVEPFWWCSAVVVTFLIGPEGGASVLVALICMAFGARVLVGHGLRVTSLGLFNYSCALFVGYAGLVAAQDDDSIVQPKYLAIALAASVLTQIVVTFVAWREPGDVVCGRLSVSDGRWLTRCALGCLVALFVLQSALARGAVLIEGAAFMCVVLVAIGVGLREGSALTKPDNLYVLAAFGVYAAYFQGGTGRLRLVAALCAVITVYTFRYPLRRIKVAMVLCTPLALYALAHQRLSYQESLSVGASAGRSGLESMLSPVIVLGQLVQGQADGSVHLSFGYSFLSVPFVFVPAAFTPAWVPDALGYALVEIVDPQRAGTGFSVASTEFGEWIYNFGLLGLVAMVPLIAWLLRQLDRRMEQAMAKLAGRRDAVVVAFWAMLAGSIGDVAWSGMHIWIARSVARLPLLAALLVIMWRPSPRRSPADRRARPRAGRHPGRDTGQSRPVLTSPLRH